MLNYTGARRPAFKLAEHYSDRLQNPLFAGFILGKEDIHSSTDARVISELFWNMTDLAIEDSQSDKEIQGIADIEFWMHKIYQKVSGYMTTHSYSEIWQTLHENR